MLSHHFDAFHHNLPTASNTRHPALYSLAEEYQDQLKEIKKEIDKIDVAMFLFLSQMARISIKFSI